MHVVLLEDLTLGPTYENNGQPDIKLLKILLELDVDLQLHDKTQFKVTRLFFYPKAYISIHNEMPQENCHKLNTTITPG